MFKSRILGALAVSKENADELINGSLAESDAAAAAATLPAAEPVAAEPAAPVIPAEPVIEEPSEAGEELAEVAAADLEVAEGESAVEQVEEAAASLEGLIDLLRANQEDGLNSQGAQLAHYAAESILKTVGLTDTAEVLPSLESFNTHSGRAKATTLSVEALSDKLKQLWAGIVEMLRKIKDGIVHFIKTLLSAQFRVSERAKKLLEAAQKTSGTSDGKGWVELGSLAGKIAIGDKIVEPLSAGVKKIHEVVESTQKFGELESQILVALYKGVSDCVTSGKAPEGTGIPTGVALPSSTAFTKPVEGQQGLKATDVLPGNVVFQAGFVERTIGPLKVSYATSGKTKVGGGEVKEARIKPLSQADLVSVVKDIISLLEATEKASKWASDEAERSKKSFAGLKIGDEGKIADVAQLKLLMRAFQRSEAEQGKAASRVAAYAIDTANSYLSVVQKTLAYYGSNTTIAKAE